MGRLGITKVDNPLTSLLWAAVTPAEIAIPKVGVKVVGAMALVGMDGDGREVKTSDRKCHGVGRTADPAASLPVPPPWRCPIVVTTVGPLVDHLSLPAQSTVIEEVGAAISAETLTTLKEEEPIIQTNTTEDKKTKEKFHLRMRIEEDIIQEVEEGKDLAIIGMEGSKTVMSV